MELELVVAILVFLALVTLIAGVWWALETRRQVRARLEGTEGGQLEAEILRRGPERSDTGLAALLRRASLYGRLADLAVQAGYRQSASDIVLVIVAFAAVGGAAGWLRTGRLFWAVPTALFAGALPIVYLLHKRNRRLARFQVQFPDALDMISRSVRAGNALSGAIKLVGEDMPDPVGQEFKQVSEEIRLGMEPGEALFRFQERVPVEDMGFFCTAIRIQRGSGGNLAEILDRLSEVIRERFRILSYARVLSAQHRWAAICVGLSPAIFSLVFQLTRPGYFEPLLKSPNGPWLIGAGVVLEAIGFLAVWRIAQIKV